MLCCEQGEAFWCSIDTSKLPMLPDGTQQKLWDQAEVDLAKERLQFAAKLQQVTRADNDSLTSVGLRKIIRLWRV